MENCLQVTESKPLILIALDVAIKKTGYSIWEVYTVKKEFSLLKLGTIETDTGDTDSRIRLILDGLTSLVNTFKINALFLEQPPETVYGNDQFAIGRAVKMFKVFMVCGAVIGYCSALNIFCRTILPSQWQTEKFQKGQSKRWSVEKANQVLKYLKFNQKLKITSDSDIADSINIAIHAIIKMFSSTWAVPNIKVTEEVYD